MRDVPASVWRGGRAVEGSCLENSRAMSSVGSNPTLSATRNRIATRKDERRCALAWTPPEFSTPVATPVSNRYPKAGTANSASSAAAASLGNAGCYACCICLFDSRCLPEHNVEKGASGTAREPQRHAVGGGTSGPWTLTISLNRIRAMAHSTKPGSSLPVDACSTRGRLLEPTSVTVLSRVNSGRKQIFGNGLDTGRSSDV
jgi:hypothetical protein